MKSFLSLFRALVPRWNFFDGPPTGPWVYVRVGTERSKLGEWTPALAPLRRRLGHLFLNPTGNARLWEISNFDRLLRESQEYIDRPGTLPASVSYRICLRSVREAVRQGHDAGARFLQFKLTAVLEHESPSEVRDALFSEVHEL